jgi:RES domain-containing protein
MITAWRIVSAKSVPAAFSGEGARIHGGRWNSKGTAIVYTSGSLSLAAMEIMVHLPAAALLDRYVTIAVEIDEHLVEAFTELPDDWNSRPAAPSTKNIGDRWVAENRSVVLKIPSVIVPAEHNYLLHPGHPDWLYIRIQEPASFSFDPRLAK